MNSVDFPFWLRATHLINFVLMGMLIRSGWEIIASLPRFWWRKDCAPGTEWIRFTKRKLPKEPGTYTSLMDEKSLTPLLGLPGNKNVGLARHWHGITDLFWAINGIVYVVLLFASGLWRTLIPTSWDVFPKAWESLTTYLTFNIPPIEDFQPFDALQQLGYAAIVFIVAPILILTGIAMSPAVRSRYPWYVKLWGSHQGARSIHFICMVIMFLFTIFHVALVFIVHPQYNLVHIVFGNNDTSKSGLALAIVLITVVLVVAFWIGLSYWTLANRKLAHSILVPATEVGRKIFLNWMRPRGATQKSYTDNDLSEWHWTNGLPPTDDESPEWVQYRDNNWDGYTITLWDDINGESKVLTLDEIKQLPQTSYIATHTCMQGWSATSRWSGVKLSDLMAVLGPKPDGANFVLVESYGLAQKMVDNRPREPFYAAYDLRTLSEDDTVLALERNGGPIELYLGAPARMRVESNHGYKHVKWVRNIRWIKDYKEYADGRGGTREDSAFQAFNGRI